MRRERTMTDAEVVECLALAHALVTAGWCKYHRAEEKDRQSTIPPSRLAVRWCALGALDAALYEVLPAAWLTEAAVQILDLLDDQVPDMPGQPRRVSTYNDRPETRKRDVLRLFEKAAACVGK